nr:hypothetical protein [Zea mays]
MGADYPKNPWEKRKDISVTKTIGGCIGEIQGFTAAQKKNRLEVRGPLVPYRTSSLRAQATTALVPFLFPFSLLLSFVPSVYGKVRDEDLSINRKECVFVIGE